MYAAVARWRRRYYEASPHRQHRLSRPVISVGNIAVGGRAKTPLAAYLARRLQALGERPSILSRGYARADAPDGVVIVRDPGGMRADLARSGDEPLMLARRFPGVAILVSPDRHLAGVLAEHHFGCTVHVLDDGFQHFQLHRDVDLVAVAPWDVQPARRFPIGRLREPLDALDSADAFVALDGAELESLAGGRPVFRGVRHHGAVCVEDPSGRRRETAPTRAVAFAGIAQPALFFRSLADAGWEIVRELRFRDHHRYTAADLTAIFSAARQSGAAMVVTTEKDLVRLLPFRPFPVAIGYPPLTVGIEPPASFDDWLRARLEDARR